MSIKKIVGKIFVRWQFLLLSAIILSHEEWLWLKLDQDNHDSTYITKYIFTVGKFFILSFFLFNYSKAKTKDSNPIVRIFCRCHSKKVWNTCVPHNQIIWQQKHNINLSNNVFRINMNNTKIISSLEHGNIISDA